MKTLLAIALTITSIAFVGCSETKENLNPNQLTHTQEACFDEAYSMRKELAENGELETRFGSGCGTAEQARNYIAGEYDVI